MTAHKPRPYYTLVAIDGSPGCPWSIEFGSFDRSDVKFEEQDFRDRGWKARELMIIVTPTSDQREIDARVAALNEAREG